MHGHFTSEIGRMRNEESIARAERYRMAQLSRRSRPKVDAPRRTATVLYRRALAAVALSILMVLGLTTAAFAYPAGPGNSAGSGSNKGITGAVESSGSELWGLQLEVLAIVAAVLLAAAAAVTMVRRQSEAF